MKPYLSVIIPMFNEERNLKRGVLGEVESFLKGKKFSWEVIISDDGSTDGSLNKVKKQISEKPGFFLLENPHGGKPSALYYGLKKAKGELTLFTDMDQSTPIGEIDKLLPFFKKGFSVVIGSRGLERKNFPFYRKLGSLVFRVFRQALLLRGIGDTQCGFKAFKTEKVKGVFPKLQFFKEKEEAIGWRVTSYDVELLYLLEKGGNKIAEVGVSWEDRDVSVGKGGNSLTKYIKETKNMFLEVVRVKINETRGLYD